MSLRFRRRFKVLPGIYLNLGKNGVSTTIGPRGANINIGRNGVYLNTGIPGTGISNRENIFKKNSSYQNLNPLSNEQNPLSITDENSTSSTYEIVTSEGLKGLKEHLEESRNRRQSLGSEIKDIENTVAELQSNLSRKQKGLFSLFTSKETVENLQNDVDETNESLENLKKEYEESKADINIQFDPEIQEQYKSLAISFSDLLKSNKIWDITNESANTEIKSSAKSIVERSEVHFQLCTIDFIESDYSAFQLQNSNGDDLYIFPGFIMILNKQLEIDLIDLKDLNFIFHNQRFQEQHETLPADSKIIDYAWFKSNKDGSRDLRFVGNYQIPIANYGAFDFNSPNGLKETYYISNNDLAAGFATQFQKYLDLLNGKQELPNSHLVFSKEYFDLLNDFIPAITTLMEKLEANETLLNKLKDTIKEITLNEFIQICVLYDFYQILKLISKGEINSSGLETFGFLLLAARIIRKLSSTFLLEMNYETLKTMFSAGIQKNVVESLIKVADIPNPLKISVQNTEKKLGNGLTITTALKAINDPLFDEYATVLYRFGNIIAKIDNVVTKEEETILKEVYQLTHNPISDEESKSLNISEVNEKETLEEVLNDLDSLIGLNSVKQEVKSLMNYIKIQKEREKVGLKSSQISYHCVFTGSPGTGKTTVARIVAKIYMHLGILKKGHLVETDRSGLVAEYSGQTAVKANKTIDSALDGVLFIDEAYSLVGENKDDFGKEAVATLIKRMEDDRDKLIVILAGYTEEMKSFIDTNPGLQSRFNRYIQFPDYSPNELVDIFKLNCSKLSYTLTDEADKNLLEIITTAFTNRDKSFGNGRFARNLFEKTIENQANRIAALPSLTKEILTTIEVADLPNK